MSVTLKEKLYQMFILGTDGGYYKELRSHRQRPFGGADPASDPGRI